MTTLLIIVLSWYVMPFQHASNNNLPRIPIDYRVHVDEIIKPYAPDKNQAIHRMISWRTMCQLELELRHLAIRLPQELEHLLFLVGSANCKLIPSHRGNLAGVIDSIGDQPILCQHRT